MIKTLYHPKFEPKENWLRAMLLFYETVHSIIPEDADYTPSLGITALREKVQEAFVPLSPTKEDLAYDWDSYYALLDVLRELSPDHGEGKGRMQARLQWPQGVPSLDLGRSVRVHTDKMADMLAHDLINLKLAERMDDPEWLRVDERVADLVLSMLADRMAKRRPELIYTSSDQEQSFAVAAKSEFDHGRSWRPEAVLASAILTAEIPAGLADLTLDRYLDVRKRYQDKQDVFRLAMHELQPSTLKRVFRALTSFVTVLRPSSQSSAKKCKYCVSNDLGSRCVVGRRSLLAASCNSPPLPFQFPYWVLPRPASRSRYKPYQVRKVGALREQTSLKRRRYWSSLNVMCAGTALGWLACFPGSSIR